MRRVIAIRKRFPAFGHGDFQLLTPANNKVLAFTRTYETQTILVVVNLSRFSQAVDLDLPNWIGWVPEDTFGHGRFPVIRDGKYPITLGAHTSYWLLLTPPEVSGVADHERLLPITQFSGEPGWWLTPAGSPFVDRELSTSIKYTRRFRTETRELLTIPLLHMFEHQFIRSR
jgi:maltose alpha-D-glucosyltransferase/alpha-amylase